MRHFGAVNERLAQVRERGRSGAGPQGPGPTGERAARSGGLMRSQVTQRLRQQSQDIEARVGAVEAQEEESFFSRYRVPVLLGGALALAGSLYYGFVVRPKQKALEEKLNVISVPLLKQIEMQG